MIALLKNDSITKIDQTVKENLDDTSRRIPPYVYQMVEQEQRCVNFWIPLLLLGNDGTGLEVLEVSVRDPLIFGLGADLACRFALGDGRKGDDSDGVYSVKWYKDGEEFYRSVFIVVYVYSIEPRPPERTQSPPVKGLLKKTPKFRPPPPAAPSFSCGSAPRVGLSPSLSSSISPTLDDQRAESVVSDRAKVLGQPKECRRERDTWNSIILLQYMLRPTCRIGSGPQ